MARKKGYPFSSRTQNKMNGLFANFLTTSLFLPFTLLSSGNGYSTYDTPKVEKKDNFKKERNLNVVNVCSYSIFSLLSVVASLFAQNPENPAFFLFCVLVRLLITIWFVIFVSTFKSQLTNDFVFNHYDVKEQILYLRDIFKYWIYSSKVNIFLDVIFIVFFAVKFYFIDGDDWSLYEVYIMTQISLYSFVVYLLLDVILNRMSINWQKKKYELISKNESYIKVMKGIRIVNPKILSELYSKNSDDKNVQFTNGGVLKIKKDVSLVNSGFSLVVNGVIKEYLFSNYIKNEMDLILRGNDVLYEMSNDINRELLRYSSVCLEKGCL